MIYTKFNAVLALILIVFNSYAQQVETLIYNQQGKLVQRNRVNFNGQIENDIFGIGIIKYEYDKSGNLSRKTFFNKDNKIYMPDTHFDNAWFPSYTIFEYNKGNKLICETNYYVDGKVMNLGAYQSAAITKYKYNTYGLLIEKCTYDKNKKLVGMYDMEIATIRYIYNDKKQLIEENNYHASGALFELGYNSKFQYDAAGKKIKSSYHYGNGSINEYTLYTYNTQDQLVQEEVFDSSSIKIGYTIYTYDGNQLSRVEKKYDILEDPIIKNNGAEIKLKGWVIEQIPEFKTMEGLSGTITFKIRINKQGEIVAASWDEHARTDLVYALFPYIRDLKFKRDESIMDSKLEGTITVTLLNLNEDISEY